MGTLGCSQHVAYVQDRCNGPRLCELIDASTITYNRKLDDISEAQVVIPISGDADQSCCACLANVEPWCHQLTVVRESDGVVWTGPITKITYTKDSVTIDAQDKLVWLLFRVNELTLSYPVPSGNKNLMEIARDIIELAMAEDDDAPCFLDCIVDFCDETPGFDCDGFPAAAAREFDFPAFGGPTAYDDFQKLDDAGMDFTVVNQCLILMSEKLPNRAIGTLTDELILGDVEIVKDGMIMGNRVYVRYEGDDDAATCQAQCNAGCSCVCPPCGSPVVFPCVTTPCPGFAETDEQCYGAIERVIDGTGAQVVETANEIAQKYVNISGKMAPRSISLPTGTRLSPECPWGINDIIPGQRMDVAISKLCLPTFQSFKIQGMTVEDSGGDEFITVDLVAVEQTTE